MPKPLPILDGRRFGCTQCAKCCTLPGFVFISWRELAAMATHLDMDCDTFREHAQVRWITDLGGWTIDTTDGKGCPLLEPEGGCRVHPVKPAQCRAFPFWPEMLDDACVWEQSKSYCEGLDALEGRLYTRDEIGFMRNLMEANDDDS